MIEILTLFVGLLTGMQVVELAVAGPVAQVEVRLDGQPLGRLTQEPWAFKLDLGPELSPHRLVAIARDREGRELGRAARWINTLADGGPAGDAPRRTAVAITLAPGTELPAVTEMGSWFLKNDQPVAVLGIEQTPAEVIIVRDPRVQLALDRISRSLIERRFEESQRPDNFWHAQVLTQGEDALVAAYTRALEKKGAAAALEPGLRATWRAWQSYLALDDDTSLRFISPLAAPVSRVQGPKQIFGFSPSLDAGGAGLLWHLISDQIPVSNIRLHDAAALATAEAYGLSRRRAIVVLLLGAGKDQSHYTSAAVRLFAERLQIPIFAWSFGAAHPDWEKGRVISIMPQEDQSADEALDAGIEVFERASRELRDELAAQRIVWLEGSHLPQNIRLASSVSGVRFSGGSGTSAGDESPGYPTAPAEAGF